MTTRLEKLPDAEGEEKQYWPRLVSVKRTTGTEQPRASLFEREARVYDANSEVQGASNEAAAALIFWFFCIKTKEHTTMKKARTLLGKRPAQTKTNVPSNFKTYLSHLW